MQCWTLLDSKSDCVPDVEMGGSTTRSNFQNMTRSEAVTEYGLLKLREEQRPSVDDCGLFPDAIVHSDGSADRLIAAAAAAYQMSEVGGFGTGSGVSLTLGLQHCEGGNLPVSTTAHHSFVSMRGDGIYSAAASSVGAENTDYECLNPGNRQHRFNSSICSMILWGRSRSNSIGFKFMGCLQLPFHGVMSILQT
ncbi:hypothetical protein GH714_031438 [Hevea brasiliensis]|uniref:Uncharacterized protein n=1 Tax=Hevea brasiliensis TaxID=3981 RepID=A0A6A6NB60_HEVBR|nr:hypothetical protein GH714_031438 [Hevea brasiliensis]